MSAEKERRWGGGVCKGKPAAADRAGQGPPCRHGFDPSRARHMRVFRRRQDGQVGVALAHKLHQRGWRREDAQVREGVIRVGLDDLVLIEHHADVTHEAVRVHHDQLDFARRADLGHLWPVVHAQS